MKPKNTICLWFDKEAHEARFYPSPTSSAENNRRVH
jgi:predicted 3-demethylubiquinone-9 3-methyltransferase (glyoxalase superfamily)